MPVQSTIDKELRLVIGAAWGCVTFEEITAHQNKLLSDPDFDPEFDQFMDASRIEDWHVSFDEADIAARRKFFSPLSRRAFVQPHPITSPLARVFEGFFAVTKRASTIEVFPDVPSALKWLGIAAPPEDQDPLSQET